MLPYSSLYEILNVPETASIDEIKSSFRKLAHLYHPDKNFNSIESETEFKVLNNAYSILSDSEKKKEYDNYLKSSSVLRNRKKEQQKRALPGIFGYYSSIESILSHINYLLWDIEDLLKMPDDNESEIGWDTIFGNKPLWHYILLILTFIDQWVLDPAGYRDYFIEARKMDKVNITEYIFESFRPGNTAHKPFFDLMDYFYDVRRRMDKFIQKARVYDMVKTLPDSEIRIIDCIFESQNLAIHYLSYINQAFEGKIIEIPDFIHSNSIFQAEQK